MCAELPLEAGLFFYCSEVWKGCPNADAEWGVVLRDYWWQGQNAFSEK